MLAYVKTLNINCDRYTRLHLVFTREQHRAGQAHRELLDACKTKDPDWQPRAVEAHHRSRRISEANLFSVTGNSIPKPHSPVSKARPAQIPTSFSGHLE